MSRPFQPSGIASRRHVPRRRASAVISSRDDDVGRDRDPPGRRAARGSASTWSSSTSESPTEWPCATRNVNAIAPPISERVAALEQRVDHAELVAHLHAAEHRDERPLRLVEQARRAPRPRRRAAGPRPTAARAAARRSTRARGARHRTRRRRTRRRARSRFVANAGSFASSPGSKRRFSIIMHVAGLEVCATFDRREAGDLGRELDRRAEQLAEPRGDRRERVLRVGLALRAARGASTARSRRRARAATRSSGSAAVMRRSSSISPSRNGTLKSARSEHARAFAQREVLQLRNRIDHPSAVSCCADGTRRGRRGGSSSPTRCRTSRAPSPCVPFAIVSSDEKMHDAGLPTMSADTSGSSLYSSTPR